jgi:hypothetical protein
VLQLALAHARDTATGLAPLLSAWLTPSKLMTLDSSAVCTALRGVPQVLASLAHGRTAVLLPELAEMVTTCGTPASPERDKGVCMGAGYLQLMQSMWEGLAAAGGVSQPPITRAALLRTAALLYEALPVIEGLLPGELETMVAMQLGGSSGPDGSHSSSQQSALPLSSEHAVWCAASRCLAALCPQLNDLPASLTDDSLLLSQQQQEPHNGTPTARAAAHAALMRCLLALQQTGNGAKGSSRKHQQGAALITLSHLAAVRAWVASHPSPPAAVMGALGAALAGLATPGQLVLTVVGPALRTGSLSGLQLAASVGAACLCRHQGSSPAAAVEAALVAALAGGLGTCNSATGYRGAVTLPFLLPRCALLVWLYFHK